MVDLGERSGRRGGVTTRVGHRSSVVGEENGCSLRQLIGSKFTLTTYEDALRGDDAISSQNGLKDDAR